MGDAHDNVPLPRHTLASETGAHRSGKGRRKMRSARSQLGKRQRIGASSGNHASPQSGKDVEEAPDEFAEMLAKAAPSDTEVAALTLRSQWPGRHVPEMDGTPPIILLSQLYALVEDHMKVDEHVECLRQQNKLRVIRLPGVSETMAYVFTEDFVETAKAGGELGDDLVALFEQVFPNCSNVLIHQAELDAVLGNDKDYATALIRKGYLTLRDENSFWFAIPNVATFLKYRKAGSKELTSALEKAPYKELPLNTLEIHKMRRSPFPAQFHVRDVVGSAQVETVSTTIGTVVRWRRPGTT